MIDLVTHEGFYSEIRWFKCLEKAKQLDQNISKSKVTLHLQDKYRKIFHMAREDSQNISVHALLHSLYESLTFKIYLAENILQCITDIFELYADQEIQLSIPESK